MKKTFTTTALALCLAAPLAFAQTAPVPAQTASATPPLSGANSFTEGQARSRIESMGYSNVTGLTKDDQSVWHATAMKDGKSTTVMLDFKGNIVAQ